jgi:hypothetical protein
LVEQYRLKKSCKMAFLPFVPAGMEADQIMVGVPELAATWLEIVVRE